ncbi:MAG: hypothetical protein AAF762_00275 [Pseudomonadota bacterium]
MTDVYDRVSFTWVSPEEMARRTAEREERWFQRQASQGQLAAPRVILDGQGGLNGLQSMQDGRLYDSKSQMRRHYREAGVIELGNDAPTTKGARVHHNRDSIKASVGKAFAAADTMSDDTIKRRRFERTGQRSEA